MKTIITVAAFIVFSQVLSAQQEISRDHNGSKSVKGFLTHQELSTDTAFSWFHSNKKAFPLDQNAVKALQANKDSINIIAFGGTWCDDTKMILPQFFNATEAAAFPDERLTLLGCDRDKKTIQHLSEVFNVTHVPTFIVMKDGKEVGRVVEYGKYGMPMKELAEIITGTNRN